MPPQILIKKDRKTFELFGLQTLIFCLKFASANKCEFISQTESSTILCKQQALLT